MWKAVSLKPHVTTLPASCHIYVHNPGSWREYGTLLCGPDQDPRAQLDIDPSVADKLADCFFFLKVCTRRDPRSWQDTFGYF